MRAVIAGLTCALLSGCATPMPAQPQAAAAEQPVNVRRGDAALQQITEISVESQCFGCTTGSLLSLHRDGRAVLTLTGNARHGTTDQISSGRITGAEFDALARVLVDQGFFGLAEIYEDPALQDGAWATTRVIRAGQEKQVFRRGEAAPAALRAVEAAVVATQGLIRFSPPGDTTDPRNRGSGK